MTKNDGISLLARRAVVRCRRPARVSCAAVLAAVALTLCSAGCSSSPRDQPAPSGPSPGATNVPASVSEGGKATSSPALTADACESHPDGSSDEAVSKAMRALRDVAPFRGWYSQHLKKIVVCVDIGSQSLSDDQQRALERKASEATGGQEVVVLPAINNTNVLD